MNILTFRSCKSKLWHLKLHKKTVFISGKVQVFTYSECTKSNWTQFSSADIHEPIEFCAGTKDGSKDACIGDSGLEFDYDNSISI